MILNKFRTLSYGRGKALILQVLALSIFSCKKTAEINSNKAYINVVHIAYGLGPITLTYGDVPLFTTPLAFGEVSGTAANPYDTTTAGVHDLQIKLNDSVLLSGNTALQQAAYYSLFLYDSLNASSTSLLVLQNNAGSRTDTFTNIRFLNFTPSSKIGLKIAYVRDSIRKVSRNDTVLISRANFVGYNPDPSIFSFTRVHIGKNRIYSYVDSTNAHAGKDSLNVRYLGTLTFDSTKNYNVFLQGFYDNHNPNASGPDSFQVKEVLIN